MNVQRTIEWIDFKEEKPAEGAYALFALSDGRVEDGFFLYDENGNPCAKICNGYVNYNVTYWAAWPEHPMIGGAFGYLDSLRKRKESMRKKEAKNGNH